MDLIVSPSSLRGRVEIPGSKSHTIRAVAIAGLASGTSRIRQPLLSHDTESASRAYEQLGATVRKESDVWIVEGTGGDVRSPSEQIDVGNSGTTLRIALGSCALLATGSVRMTGDAQIQRRPAQPLIDSLNDLGAKITSTKSNGCAPFEIAGGLVGGETSIEAQTSQYVTSLLMCTPLAKRDSLIRVPLLNEVPYVGITLDWLRTQGISLEYEDDYSEFRVPGGQQFSPVDRRIPGDFSSATFFLAAGALGDNDVVSAGLDMEDTQGDKAVVAYLRELGADISIDDDGIRVCAKELLGCDLDLNATPDALPMMAVVGSFAQGTTRLLNCPQARIKETDRIAVMKEELTKMGGDLEELEDGLVIHQSDLRGAEVDSHDDHRVAMSLAIAATGAQGTTRIRNAEAMSVTYPGFERDLEGLGATVEIQ